MKTKQCFFSTMLLLFLVGMTTKSFALENALSKLDSSSIECMETRKILPCQNALSETEVLQRQAASDGNYACQSRLLGLGAYLLMVTLNSRQSELDLEMLREVKTFCFDL